VYETRPKILNLDESWMKLLLLGTLLLNEREIERLPPPCCSLLAPSVCAREWRSATPAVQFTRARRGKQTHWSGELTLFDKYSLSVFGVWKTLFAV